MQRIAERASLTGFKGFCPVALREQRDLVDSLAAYHSTYEGKTYFFSSGEAKTKFDAQPELYAPVSGGNDTILLGNTAAAWVVKNNPALKLSLVHSTGLVFAVPVRKDNTALRDRIDMAIECMKRDGFLAQLHEKWFGTKPAADSASVKIFPGYGVPDMPGYDPKPHEPACS